MKKSTVLICSILSLISLFSCTITTSVPNVTKGVWVRYKEASTANNEYTLEHRLTLSDGLTYTHEVITEDDDLITYTGVYEMNYSSFTPLESSGVIALNGATENGDKTEKRSFYFIWKATAEQGPRTLNLTDIDKNVELNLVYVKGAV